MVLLVVREYSAAHLRKHSHECKKVVAAVGFDHALLMRLGDIAPS